MLNAFRSRRSLRSRLFSYLLLGLLLTTVGSCSKPTKPCSSCGSGSVSWDGGVNRCRDTANGQFVKSCCCGH